ncbi:MAG: carotenoid 1,2-hydratase [Blastocatellia bacterium]|nr:carotenoid 1,2-hydratase [Blastocatellia bacterium]
MMRLVRTIGAGSIRMRAVASAFVLVALVGAMAAQTADGWRQAAPGRAFVFPADHASHPDYKVEWWYYTGNVVDADGRRYGYQLTFFRIGVDPKPENPSRWAVRDLFMTHLAVTDVDGRVFRFAERVNRAGVGWAGAATDVYRVWNEDWEGRLDPSTGRHVLRAAEGGLGVELELEPGKAPVRHGRDGYSQKGADAGNASHYYSMTRMPTRGTLTIEGRTVAVEGLSWMDHEFGTSFLESGQRGWDWFSIQFDDRTELMIFQLRREDGSLDPRSSGTWIGASGEASSIAAETFSLVPGEMWRSEVSGAEYPTRWTMEVPERRLSLTVRAAFEGQELVTDRSTGVTYWEGAVIVEGTRDGNRVAGRGYLEMTGYSGQAMGRLLQ